MYQEKNEIIIRTLRCPLTDEQQIEIGQRLAEINIEIEAKIELKKALPKEIEGLQERAASLGHTLKDGSELKEVECYWSLDDPEEGKKQLYRVDTAESVGDPVDMELFDVEELPENPEEKMEEENAE